LQSPNWLLKLSDADVRHLEQVTRNWIRDFVLDLQLCPFARAPFVSGQVRIAVHEASTSKAVEQTLLEEAATLLRAQPTELATTLVVLPNFYPADFGRFYASSLKLERRWEAHEFGDSFVLVFFHPLHTYAKQDQCSKRLAHANNLDYERRAPLPTINILRGEQVDEAIAEGKSAEMLEQNALRLQRIPADTLEMRFRRLRMPCP
jgi:hypothetical protein